MAEYDFGSYSEGFDYEKAKKELNIPDDYEVIAMVAIGKKGAKDSLAATLGDREFPSNRKSLTEIVMEGFFKKQAEIALKE